MADVVRKTTAVDEVADGVRSRILGGTLLAGTDLPAERELCEELGVSRLTLRAAITRLEGEGLLRPKHGSGTRVLDYRETGGLDLIGYLARYSLEGGRVPVALLADLLEVRRSLAVEVVGLVAERASASELVMLRAHQLPRDAQPRARAAVQHHRAADRGSAGHRARVHGRAEAHARDVSTRSRLRRSA